MRGFWLAYYFVMGCDDTLSARTIMYCRLNGIKLTELGVSKVATSDFVTRG